MGAVWTVGAASGAMFLLAAVAVVAGTEAVINLAALAAGFGLYAMWSVMVAAHIRRTSAVHKDRPAAQ